MPKASRVKPRPRARTINDILSRMDVPALGLAGTTAGGYGSDVVRTRTQHGTQRRSKT